MWLRSYWICGKNFKNIKIKRILKTCAFQNKINHKINIYITANISDKLCKTIAFDGTKDGPFFRMSIKSLFFVNCAFVASFLSLFVIFRAKKKNLEKRINVKQYTTWWPNDNVKYTKEESKRRRRKRQTTEWTRIESIQTVCVCNIRICDIMQSSMQFFFWFCANSLKSIKCIQEKEHKWHRITV